jgi:hypothetical protein
LAALEFSASISTQSAGRGSAAERIERVEMSLPQREVMD